VAEPLRFDHGFRGTSIFLCHTFAHRLDDRSPLYGHAHDIARLPHRFEVICTGYDEVLRTQVYDTIYYHFTTTVEGRWADVIVSREDRGIAEWLANRSKTDDVPLECDLGRIGFIVAPPPPSPLTNGNASPTIGSPTPSSVAPPAADAAGSAPAAA